jgi:hypothetical protein
VADESQPERPPLSPAAAQARRRLLARLREVRKQSEFNRRLKGNP